MGWVELGGGCLAWLFFEGGGRVGHSPLQGLHLLSWGSAKAGPVARLRLRLRGSLAGRLSV